MTLLGLEAIFIIIAVVIMGLLTWQGVRLCANQNYWGFLLLFLGLGILGLVIGFCVIKQGEKE